MSEGERLVVGAVLATAAVAACGSGGAPAMDKVFETEHFIYYRQAGAPAPCPSLGDWLERYYRAFEGFLGVSRPTLNKVSYHLYSDANASLAACSGAGRNCYLPSSETIVSLEPLKPHEIVHVFERLIGTPAPAPAMFSEGIATMLGGSVGPPREDGRLDTSLDIENLLGSKAFYARTDDVGPAITYSAAAGFMRFLLDRYGKDAFLSMYGGLDNVSESAEVERQFEATVGEALRDVIAAWQTAVAPPYDEVVLNTPLCDQLRALAPDGSTVLDPGCAFDAARFDVPISGRLDVLLHRIPGQAAESLAFAHVYRCEGGVPLDAGIFVRGELHLALDVAPGTYMLSIDGAQVSAVNAAQPVTLDLDAACTTGRIAAAIGGPDSGSLLVVRRWVAPETGLALDLDIGSAGQLGLGGVSTELAMPYDVYACPQACVADPDQQCGHDSLPGVQTMGEPRDVFGMRVAAGDRLHLETGPRIKPAWQYSLQLSVDLTTP